MGDPVVIAELFDVDRLPSLLSNCLLVLYLPIGCLIFLLRVFIGIHAFIVACLLRKSASLRTIVLRIMCTVLGIVVRQEGSRAKDVRMMCANHVSALDHLAVDLVQPCILPSVWDIPSVLRWCFGYADLGARSGRGELIRQARLHVASDALPLLSFPEGAITSGRRALLKFSTWPAEVSPIIQPVAITVWRPVDVRASLLGATWWADVFWFLALPFTVLHLNWLPVLVRTEEEPVEDFSGRVSRCIAASLEVKTSNFTNIDAAEAAKRHLRSSAATVTVKKVPLDPRRMDEVAMRIKQSHPSMSLLAIRLDLEKTKDQNETIERIKLGKLSLDVNNGSGKVSSDSADWRKVFDVRKWEMIESNRARYLGRMQSDIAAAGDS